MAPIIEVITEKLTLGEGPHWHATTKNLYFVDIFGQTINRYLPETKQHFKAKIEGGPVSMIIPIHGKTNKFLVAIGKKLAVVTWDGVKSPPSDVETLLEVDNEADLKENRFNDGKADPNGVLWAGTMGPEPEIGKLEPEKGNLYTLTNKSTVRRHLSKVSIANGLAWDLKLKKMYYIDSPKRTVDVYDYDADKVEISNCKVAFDLDKHNIPGVPDGMTMDSDGNLWVAVFNGARILHVNPRNGTLLNTINFPTKQITSAVFGGDDLDVLYVTSARLPIKGEIETDSAGVVFKVTGLNVKGTPSYDVKF